MKKYEIFIEACEDCPEYLHHEYTCRMTGKRFDEKNISFNPYLDIYSECILENARKLI